VGETTDYYCWGTIGSGTKGAGRIARQIIPSTYARSDNSTINGLTFLSDPCWVTQNNYTSEVLLYNETIYGTKYNMSFCQHAAALEDLMEEPSMVPAWSAWLYNNELYAEDDTHYMQENTHAVWIADDIQAGGYWQRFWRDITATNNTQKVWVEYSPDGEDWYPVLSKEYGNRVGPTSK
jgi:hypothetical protein